MTENEDKNATRDAIAEFHEYAVHHVNEAHHYTNKLIDRIPTGEKRNLYTEANIHFLLAQEALNKAKNA